MTFYDLESKPDVIKYHLDNIKPFVKLRLDNSSLNKHLKAFIETSGSARCEAAVKWHC